MRTQRERERDTESEGEIARKETEIGGVKRIWGSRLKGVPQREGRGSSDSKRRVTVCHEMPIGEPGVTSTKTTQDHLSVSGPLCEGTPSVDGGFNQGQLIFGTAGSIP